MEKKARNVVVFYCVVSIIAIIYYFIPIYTLIAVPFLLGSIALAATSRFNLSYKLGLVWIVIIGAIMIPMFVTILFNLHLPGIIAGFTYLSVGLVFYTLVCVSSVLIYRLSKEEPSKVRKIGKGVVESEISHYCRFCGSEIEEGENICPNCSSSLTEE